MDTEPHTPQGHEPSPSQDSAEGRASVLISTTEFDASISRTPICCGTGVKDTRKAGGKPYATTTMAEILAMTKDPACVAKTAAPWAIFSTYAESAAREHKAQEQHGRFVAAILDVDHGDTSLEDLRDSVHMVTGGAFFFAWASKSATEQDKRWRVVIPTSHPVPAQRIKAITGVLIEQLAKCDVNVGSESARPGQVWFLPNRGEYWASVVSESASKRLNVDYAPFIAAEAALAAETAPAVHKGERIQPSFPGDVRAGSVIDAFNDANKVANLLNFYGYENDGAGNYRSRYQTSGSYATKIYDENDRWVSLSQSDVAAGLGTSNGHSCYGDAFDLLVHYHFAGDRSAAIKAAAKELGMSSQNNSRDHAYAPPQWHSEPVDNDPEDPTSSGQGPSDTQAPPDWHEDAEKAAFERTEPNEPKAVLRGHEPLTRETLFSIPAEEPALLDDAHYRRGQLTVLAGTPGVGKSTVLTLHIFELAKSGNRVLVVSAEDPEVVYRRQLAALVASVPFDEQMRVGDGIDEVLGRINFTEAYQMPALIQRSGGEFVPNTEVSRNLLEAIRPYAPDLLVCETMSTLGVGDESNSAMRSFCLVMSDIGRRLNCAVVVSHHLRKMGTGEKQLGQDADITLDVLRGGSALGGAAREVLILKQASRDAVDMYQGAGHISPEDAANNRMITLLHLKANASECRQPVHYLRSGQVFPQAGGVSGERPVAKRLPVIDGERAAEIKETVKATKAANAQADRYAEHIRYLRLWISSCNDSGVHAVINGDLGLKNLRKDSIARGSPSGQTLAPTLYEAARRGDLRAVTFTNAKGVDSTRFELT